MTIPKSVMTDKWRGLSLDQSGSAELGGGSASPETLAACVRVSVCVLGVGGGGVDNGKETGLS